jgi:hypothetical protein
MSNEFRVWKSEQEAFDHVLTRLREQKVGSSVEGVCRYRGHGDHCCGVGHLMSDITYNPEMEGSGVLSLDKTKHLNMENPQTLDVKLLPEFVNLSGDFLQAIQTSHDSHLTAPGVRDGFSLMRGWENSMARGAVRFGLTYTAPGKVAKPA